MPLDAVSVDAAEISVRLSSNICSVYRLSDCVLAAKTSWLWPELQGALAVEPTPRHLT